MLSAVPGVSECRKGLATPPVRSLQIIEEFILSSLTLFWVLGQRVGLVFTFPLSLAFTAFIIRVSFPLRRSELQKCSLVVLP